MGSIKAHFELIWLFLLFSLLCIVLYNCSNKKNAIIYQLPKGKIKIVDYKNKVINSIDYGRPHITATLQSPKYKIGEDISMKVTFKNPTNEKIIIFPTEIDIWYEIRDKDTGEFIQSGPGLHFTSGIAVYPHYKDLSAVSPKNKFLDWHCGKELLPNGVHSTIINLKNELSPIKEGGIVGKYIITLEYKDFILFRVRIKDNDVEYRENIRIKEGLYDNIITAQTQFYLED